MAGDWKTIDQRERSQRRSRKTQALGITAGSYGGIATMLGHSRMSTDHTLYGGPSPKEGRKFIREPLTRSYGTMKEHPDIRANFGARHRLGETWRRAGHITGGRLHTGGMATMAAGASVYAAGRAQDSYHQARINSRRKANASRVKKGEWTVNKSSTYGGTSCVGRRYRDEPVSKLAFVPTNVLRNKQPLQGPTAPTPQTPMTPTAPGAPQPGAAAGRTAPKAGAAVPAQATSTSMTPQAAVPGAKPQQSLATMNSLKPKPPAQNMAKAAPKLVDRFDPEDRRQRRHGLASGVALTGGAITAQRGARGESGLLRVARETKSIPLNRVTGRVAGGLGLVAVGAGIYNRGNRATNRRWH